MTFQLLSVLSAAALAATGLGAPGETRSAQSLPAENLALAQAPAGSTGKFHTVKHLADAPSDQSDEGKCKREREDADGHKRRCRKGGWWMDTGSRLLIGAGTVSGLVYAVSQGGGGSVSH